MDKRPRSTDQIDLDPDKKRRSSNQIVIGNSTTREPCKYYQTGNCWFGQNCKYVHSEGKSSHFVREQPGASSRKVRRWKTKFCPSWEKLGSCSRGADCKFAHGINELRSSDEVTHEVISDSGTGSATAPPQGTYHDLRGQSGVQHDNISNFGTMSATAGLRGPYREIRGQGQSGVQRSQSAAADPRGDYGGPVNAPVRGQIISNIRPESTAADPHGQYGGPVNAPARDQIISNIRPESAAADPRGQYGGPADVPGPNRDGPRRKFNWNKKLVGIYGDWVDKDGNLVDEVPWPDDFV